MTEAFADILNTGGHANSLGRANEVIELVLRDQSRLNELYDCLFHEDAWVRMRAADALEKICRQHPDWLLPYIDKFQTELADSPQASIQWHLAQIYAQVSLTAQQKQVAIAWLKQILSNKEADWIAASNAMEALAQFTREGSLPVTELIPLLKVQQQHKSKAVVKRANKLIGSLT